MTTEPGGEATEVVTTTAAPEAAVSSQEKARDWEAEAEAFGWVPQDQFKGDPEKWRPAEEFVRRGEEILPIVRKQNEKLSAKVTELEETNKRMSAMFEKTAARIKAEYEAKIVDLKAEKKEAIKEGDADRVEQIEAQIDTLKEATADGPDPTLEKGGKKDQNALIRDFATANTWFVEEPDMQEYAVKVSESNAALNDGISFEDNMKFVLGAVRRKFPSYFKDSTTAANGHAAVDSGGSFNGGPVRDDTYGLNKIELDQADKDIAAKLYKNRKEWARVYRGQ